MFCLLSSSFFTKTCRALINWPPDVEKYWETESERAKIIWIILFVFARRELMCVLFLFFLNHHLIVGLSAREKKKEKRERGEQLCQVWGILSSLLFLLGRSYFRPVHGLNTNTQAVRLLSSFSSRLHLLLLSNNYIFPIYKLEERKK